MVLGISPDDVKSHRRFKEKFSLPFTLLADADHQVAEAYGVWKQKSMFGNLFMGVERTTVIIGPDGRVARVFPKVSVEGHAEEVLEAVRAIVG